MATEIIHDLVPALVAGLQEDDSDDVRGAASDALRPLAHSVVTHAPHMVAQLLEILWDATLSLDELTASTPSVLRLLAVLLSEGL